MTWWLALLACSPGPAPSPPPVPGGVEVLRIDDPGGWWVSEGYHPLAPPVQLPAVGEDGDVVVWVHVPDGARLDRVGGRLTWPPGSAADRVERRVRDGTLGVVDVRGTRLDDQGRAHDHLLRPFRDAAGEHLVGVSWPAGDPEAKSRALDWLEARLAPVPPLSERSEAYRARWGESLRRKAACRRCHVPGRPDARTLGEHGAVARGTDAAGWFTPRTLGADTAPLEAYGAGDPNLADPHVSVACPGGDAPAPDGDDGRPTCRDGAIPRASYDVRAALAAGDARARAVCASRSWLAQRMTDGLREAWSPALAACGIIDENAMNSP